MNDNPRTDNTDRNLVPERSAPTRPPIQWPVRSESDPEKERAAAYARSHVERTYAKHGEPNQEPKTVASHNQHLPQVESHTMRELPYDWDQYHTAWQQYYHQYFYRYYAGWWHQQKQQESAQAGNEPESKHEVAADSLSERQKVAKELREKVRSTVEERSKKVKSSSHFKPILAAVTVGSLFLFVNYNQIVVGAVKQYIAPGSVVTTPVIVEPNSQAIIGPEPRIIIPKIGVDAPVIYDEPRVDEPSYQAALDRGVVRLGNTADPGTKGNLVLGGHSSNNVFNSGQFKYVFVNLRRLDVGDIFYLNYEGKRYTYKITVANKIVTPTDVSVLNPTENPTVTLFTCDPPGTNVNRLIVQADQIDPSPAAATESTNERTEINQENPLPSVAPSFWDRFF